MFNFFAGNLIILFFSQNWEYLSDLTPCIKVELRNGDSEFSQVCVSSLSQTLSMEIQ